MITPEYVSGLVSHAIAEDIGSGDITANLLPETQWARAKIITREPAIVCGSLFAAEVYRQLNPAVTMSWQVTEGQAVNANETLCTLEGPAKVLLTGERTALNFLQTLSGTATQTNHYVKMLAAGKTQLLDTRKTIPGLRIAQKYAVQCGGGKNHRLGLFDAFLIKENHIAACGSITQAVQLAKESHPTKVVEVEVESIEELREALDSEADIILLDNFNLDTLYQAVQINAGKAKLEVSGNVTEHNLADIAATGIDYVSVGALTKHVRAIDLSMRLFL